MGPLWRFNRKGQVFILLALVLLVLLIFAGLAVDVGMAYVVKTRLNAAVDAAALAAGRVVAADDGSAISEGEKFFHANYPDGLMGAAVQEPSVGSEYDGRSRSWTVTVSSTAQVPTYFVKAVGWPALTVQATATTTVNPVDLVLVMDTTRSLGCPPSPEGTLETLKNAAKNFVGRFNPKNDRVGLVRYACGAVEDARITAARGFNQKRIDDALNAMTAGGFTTAEEALRLAKVQLDGVPADRRAPTRIIVFFTDGAPNGVAADFTTGSGTRVGTLSSEPGDFLTLRDVSRIQHSLNQDATGALPDRDWTGTISTYSYNNIRSFESPSGAPLPLTRCNINMAARNMLENVANDARNGTGESGSKITIFTIGLGAFLTTLEVPNYCPAYGSNEFGQNILQRIANTRDSDTYNGQQPTGVYAFAASAGQLNAAFDQVARAILRISR